MQNKTFLSFLISEIIQDLMRNKVDVEYKLHSMGLNIGSKLLEVYEFNRDCDLSSLLYKITYQLLPQIYETARTVEKLKERDNQFIITEDEPLLGEFISVPPESEGFSADSVIAGVIEVAILASGFKCTVNAYTSPESSLKTKTFYLIEMKNE